ncbi:MAG: DNA helicase PcrA [Clostridiales bacterium]|nr:DNA helicase PcrA [Clostridiales bacterium]
MDKYQSLNEMQKRAVFQTEGAVLILAGAGSGKTRVLTHRMAYLIEEIMVPSYHILAITFTNKAAKEMKDRVERLIGDQAKDAWVSTFHSACIRILKRHADKLGYENGFTIYDPEDQKALIRRILRDLNLNEKMFTPKALLTAISNAKDELITADRYEQMAGSDPFKSKVAMIYHQYQKLLFENQAMDFDDIIVKTVQLFRSFPEVLDYYQEKFRYIMVDEYQDTNMAQYHLIRLLAGKYGNLCVVGDDDQSIYKFRGANIRNILDFEKDFPNCMVVRLEQNYRSTKKILLAANAVIRNNEGRKDKTLWTENEEGRPITVYEAGTEKDEAAFVASTIHDLKDREAMSYKDIAILYRTNAQSRALEEGFLFANIPYRLYGGTPFYQRREIKDLLCYLRLIVNDKDYTALERVINVPKRGIGTTTSERLRAFCLEHEMGVSEAIPACRNDTDMKRASKKLDLFAELLEDLRAYRDGHSLTELIDYLIDTTDYHSYLKEEDEERYEDRVQNIEELTNRAAEFVEQSEDASLEAFLDELSLVAAIDSFEEGADAVSLMTLHSAKGLEFPIIFICGMEDGVFPGYMSMMAEDEEEMEEERRLCYVGITRAQRRLYLTHAGSRRVHGVEQISKPSRFLKELPEELVERTFFHQEPVQEPKRRQFVQTPDVRIQNRYVPGGTIRREKPVIQQTPQQVEQFAVGDLVTHKKFGLGTVLEVTSVNADYQVRVRFVKVGEKTLFAKLAGLKKVTE